MRKCDRRSDLRSDQTASSEMVRTRSIVGARCDVFAAAMLAAVQIRLFSKYSVELL